MLAKTPMHTQIAHRAIELLKQHGWCQDQSESQDGRICLMRAVQLAAMDVLGAPRAYVRPGPELELCRTAMLHNNEFARRLHHLLVLSRLAENQMAIEPVTWNDTKSRTVEEVIQLLERAAAEL
jgi:hypothetical protein